MQIINFDRRAIRPAMPTNFQAIPAHNSLELSWVKPIDENIYKSYIWVSGSNSETEVEGAQFFVENLEPGTTYCVALQLENELRQRSLRVYGSFTTLEDLPSTPDNLTTTRQTTTSVDLAWDQASGGPGLMYEIDVDGVLYETTDQATISVEGLASGTEYKFAISSYDQRGNFSAPVSIVHRTLDELSVRRVIASPRHDAFAFDAADTFPRTGFPGAQLELDIVGGERPYNLTVSDSAVATLNGNVVTLHKKGSVIVVIEDSQGVKVNYLINPLHWFSTPSNVTYTHAQAAAQGPLPDVHIMSTRGGAGDRRVGSLCSEWGDLSRYGWPQTNDTVSYWTRNASPEPPQGRTYEAVNTANNRWGGRLETIMYYASFMS